MAAREADKPIPVPPVLPAQTPPAPQPRYTESSIYPYLETNVDYLPMQFSREEIPADKTELSLSLHGPDTPFRHYSVLQRYIQDLVNRDSYGDLVEYNTTVERVEKFYDTTEKRNVLLTSTAQEVVRVQARLDAFPAYQRVLRAEIALQSGRTVRMRSESELGRAQLLWESHLETLTSR